MDIETSSAIKLFFPNPSLALVYFEAIANSLDAGANEISIRIDIQAFAEPDTLNIHISDNGGGFTEESFLRFRKLLKPKDIFHKGIGRLVFLNYFGKVAISSFYEDRHRAFVFEENFDGTCRDESQTVPTRSLTTLTFSGFQKDKVKTYDDLKPGSLKERIIEHFLPTLNGLKNYGVEFKIKIELTTKENNAQREFFSHDTQISAEDLPELTAVEIQDPFLDAYSSIQMLYHIKSGTKKTGISTAFSIDGRTIPVSLVQDSAIPAGYQVTVIFSSDLFGATADSSRQKLVLPNGISESILYSILRRAVGALMEREIPKISSANFSSNCSFAS